MGYVHKEPLDVLEAELNDWKNLLEQQTRNHNQMLKDLTDINEKIKTSTDAIARYTKLIATIRPKQLKRKTTEVPILSE